MDFTGIKELATGPGTDTRQWVSYGQVIADTGSARSVRFNDPTGQPLPEGVLVDVKLAPSRITVPCRVASPCSGNGEGEYHPFVPGDEVVVLLPQGDERAGCVIIGRVNQAHDVFPTKVAGMDATTNSFGFKRHIMPFVTEVGQSWMVRSAGTNASITIDPVGQILIGGADGALLMMGPDVISLMNDKQVSGMQIDVADDKVLIKADTAMLTLDAANTTFMSKGTVSFSPCGNPGVNHVLTTEALTQILSGLLNSLAAVLSPIVTPMPGSVLAGLLAVPGPGLALIEGALALAPTIPNSLFTAAITGAMLVPKTAGINAGVGSAGMLVD